MDDQEVEMLLPNYDDNFPDYDAKDSSISCTDNPLTIATCDAGEILETATCNTEPAQQNTDSVEENSASSEFQENDAPNELDEHSATNEIHENSVSNEIQECFSDNEQTLPILQKIVDLSTKIQNLKKEHQLLSSHVKDVASGFLASPDVLETLRILNTEYELLKKKYLEETSERKRLYNEVIELKGNIRVFCRCRPLNQVEITNGSTSVVEYDSSQENELQIVCSDSSKKQFKFDHVFRPEDDQEAVFAKTRPAVTSVLDGYNVCIFAYGQTGTGKTFTMEGSPENRGVNYRTLEELFRLSEERSNIMRYDIFVSMLEVYNEKIRDLLVDNTNQPTKRLEIKQVAEGTQEVPGLVEASVKGTTEVWDLVKSGSRARSVGSTSANELSSRSHCLLRVSVKGENLINGQRTKSHLWLVDLAGSERVGRIEVEGERLKESLFINKSLSALGDVISALASKTSHIPYRNSKLTHILQSSLGGDCKTLMFVQISPSSVDLGETICSLNFASRVRGIESGPARKQIDVTELFKYKQMAEKLKQDEKETKKLQDNMQSLQLRLAAREHICRSLQEKVRDLENQLAEERKMRLKQERRSVTASAQSSELSFVTQAQKSVTEKKPPLIPSKLRMPLRRISNFMPPPTPLGQKNVTEKNPSMVPSGLKLPLRKLSNFFPPPSPLPPCKGFTTSTDNKENAPKSTAAATNTRNLFKPRRSSIAVKPPQTTTQVFQPRRRVSIATLHLEPPNSQMMTPLDTSRMKFGSAMGRQSFIRDSRKARYSKLFSPLPDTKTSAETTPIAMRSSSKFMGSPPTQAGSWKPKHPTVVALQRKTLVWSPLQLRGMKNYRKSSMVPLPSRSKIQ